MRAKFRAGNAEFNGSNCLLGSAVQMVYGTLYSVGWRQHVSVRSKGPSYVERCLGLGGQEESNEQPPQYGVTFARRTYDPA